jgi:hypothetical protein
MQSKGGFSSIILGRTPILFEGRMVYAKHYGFHDNVETDFVYEIELKKAEESGIDSEEERLAFLFREGLWSEEEETEIARLESSIKQSEKTKNNIFIPSQKEEFKKQIEDLSQKLYELKSRKIELMGKTREHLARQESEAYFILNTIFVDPDLSELLYPPKVQEEVSDGDLSKAVNTYNEAFKFLVNGGIRHVALSNEAQTLVSMADNAYYFYGKPVSLLTFFQSELFVYAKNYASMLSHEVQPPENVTTDPDKLEDWYNSVVNSKKWIKNDSGSSSVFGTADDVRQLTGEVFDMDSELKKAAAESGGVVDMITLAKMQGKKV